MVTVTKTTGASELKHVAKEGEHTAHVEGAPNRILEKCTSIMGDGSVKPLDAAGKKAVLDKVDELTEQALRVLAVATRNIGGQLFDSEADTDVKFAKIVDGLLFGLCASIDPERDGVKDAVLQSRRRAFAS